MKSRIVYEFLPSRTTGSESISGPVTKHIGLCRSGSECCRFAIAQRTGNVVGELSAGLHAGHSGRFVVATYTSRQCVTATKRSSVSLVVLSAV